MKPQIHFCLDIYIISESLVIGSKEAMHFAHNVRILELQAVFEAIPLLPRPHLLKRNIWGPLYFVRCEVTYLMNKLM